MRRGWGVLEVPHRPSPAGRFPKQKRGPGGLRPPGAARGSERSGQRFCRWDFFSLFFFTLSFSVSLIICCSFISSFPSFFFLFFVSFPFFDFLYLSFSLLFSLHFFSSLFLSFPLSFSPPPRLFFSPSLPFLTLLSYFFFNFISPFPPNFFPFLLFSLRFFPLYFSPFHPQL